jgi:hypothetical protein
LSKKSEKMLGNLDSFFLISAIDIPPIFGLFSTRNTKTGEILFTAD